jgi:hypothetical protein
MASTVFNLGAVKLLKKILRFQDSDVQIITGNAANPTVTAVDAVSGSIYIQAGTSNLYIKQDNGSTTNFALTSTSATLASYILTSQKGVANGVASLDSGGKIPSAQLPSTVMDYKGNYDASTNTPTLVDGTGNAGDVYRVNVAGSQDFGSGPQTLAVGDWVVYSGTIWEKSSNSNAVMSVNGFTGTVVLSTTDIAEGSNLYYTTARFNTALASKSTTDLAEGTNLYYTAARFNTAFSGKSTSDLAEGSNLYFTDERVDDRVAALVQAGTNIAVTYDDVANTLTIDSTGSYTDEQAQDAVGGILTDTATIDLNYNDVGNIITANVQANSIDGTHIMSGLNVNKLSSGSVTNTEFDYLSAATSNIQGQLNDKEPIHNTTLTQDYNLTLGANVTNEVVTVLTFAHAAYNGCIVDYRISKGTLVRAGRLLVASDGTNVSLNDSFVETVDSTIVFEAVINGANINIRHTNTESGTILITYQQNKFNV